MSLIPEQYDSIPDQTICVAKAVFPKGNIYMKIRDELGTIFSDEDFTSLYPSKGQPAQSPARLAWITILQFAEDLTDRQAADAVRSRIDWKYLLALELTDPGFDYSILSEFRTRLVSGSVEHLIFEKLLERIHTLGLIKAGGKQRTDSTHVLAAIREISRLELVGETIRHALNSLAIVAPDWLRKISRPEWVERYDRRIEEYHLPKSDSKRLETAQQYGEDGLLLLNIIFSSIAEEWLRKIPAVDMLRRIWVQQYYISDERIHWRKSEELPPASILINSPYDADAHYGKKRTTYWIGYKVHLTETCEPDQPHIITNVETTSASIADVAVTSTIHQSLEEKALLPNLHIVDSGYIDAELLATSHQQFKLDLFGPTRSDYRWQAKAGQGFDAAHFTIDWEKQQAVCPEGHTSISWIPVMHVRSGKMINIRFSNFDCGVCPKRIHCTRSKDKGRVIAIRPSEHHQALQAARLRETTPEFKKQYALRAAVEGTIAQGVRAFGLRRTRYIGIAKTHLQNLLIATAINVNRIGHWLSGAQLVKTQIPAFIRLMAQAA